MKKITSFIAYTALLFPMFCLAQNTPSISQNLEKYLRRAAENGYSGSVLVASKDQILLENGFGNADREAKRAQTAATIFSIGSITKQFTGAAIVKLWEMGKLDFDDQILKFFPDAPADKAKISVHQLLTHTAGFPDALGDDYENLDAAQFTRLAFSTPLQNPPGATYQYSNVGYSLLGIIIEKLSGGSYENFLHDQLWKPTGMTQTGYLLPKHTPAQLAVGYQNGKRWGTALDRAWLPDGPGWHLRANGGVLSTAGDMHRWYKALKNNVVLSKAATEKLFTPHVAEGPDAQSFYGYGWVVQDEDGKRTIWHNGGNGVYNAFMGFDLANDLCIVVSSNSNDKISDRIALDIQRLLATDGSMLDDDFIKKFKGKYRLPSGSTFEANIDESNRLKVLFESAEPLQLFSADGSENPTETAPVGQRTVKMLEAVGQGDFSLLAKYRDVPLEVAQQRIRPFWEQMQAERGRIAGVDLVGVVARPRAGLMLAFVRVNFEKSPLFFMYIWRGEQIDDVQEMPVLDKTFEWKDGKNTFHAANNGRSIVAETDASGTAVLIVKHPDGDVKAVRVGDLSRRQNE